MHSHALYNACMLIIAYCEINYKNTKQIFVSKILYRFFFSIYNNTYSAIMYR